MAQLPNFGETPCLLKKLNTLIDQLSPADRCDLSLSFQTKIRKVAELYTSIKPEEVLI